jgi:hypothetical protein
MATRNFFDSPNALKWLNYYGNQAPGAGVQPTMADFAPPGTIRQGTPIAPAPGGMQTPPIAGQTQAGNVYQRVMSQLPPELFGDDKDPMAKYMRWSIFRDMYENDPEIIKQRGEIYGNIMNEMADKANARAMQGHLFAGLLNLPKQFSAAAERRMEYLPYQMQAAQPPQVSRFVTRQYATAV